MVTITNMAAGARVIHATVTGCDMHGRSTNCPAFVCRASLGAAGVLWLWASSPPPSCLPRAAPVQCECMADEVDCLCVQAKVCVEC